MKITIEGTTDGDEFLWAAMQIRDRDPDWFQNLANSVRRRMQLVDNVDVVFVVDGKTVYP